jgi:type IV secretion system protein VirB10
MVQAPRNLPPGNDPRLKLDPEDLSAASERALPEVARAKGGFDFGLVGMGLAALALGGVVFFGMGRKPAPPAPVQAPPSPVQPVSVLPPINPSINPPVEAPPMVQPMPPAPVVAPAPAPDAAAARAPALVIDNSAPGTPAPAASAAPIEPNRVTLNANDQFAARVNGDITQKASKIGDPSKVVPAGAVIPAVLETAINSDLPGYTRAIVSRDIRSFDGTTILIPRGSRLIGQYKSGLASGETRAFIIWNRLIRPDGVSVQLASPSTDDLGQAGASGSVDSHFVKRFGAAMLLSVVNGLAGNLSKSNTSNTIVIGTSADAQNVASEALSNDVKIPPTIKVPQGAPIQVFAARDLDFAL